MQVKFGRIERPRKIAVDEATMSSTFARFIAEPFERVIGHSMGNTLRRILLSSLEAPGIISICIEGISHEFAAIEGVKEDVTELILNIKSLALKMDGEGPRTIYIDAKGNINFRKGNISEVPYGVTPPPDLSKNFISLLAIVTNSSAPYQFPTFFKASLGHLSMQRLQKLHFL